jgi:hypothetical protein
MLSIEKCKKLIPADPKLDNQQLEALRHAFYEIAHVIVGRFEHKRSLSHCGTVEPKQEHASFEEIVSALPKEEREIVEERAAIMQFDGGCDREIAERYALRDYWNGKLGDGKNGN